VTKVHTSDFQPWLYAYQWKSWLRLCPSGWINMHQVMHGQVSLQSRVRAVRNEQGGLVAECHTENGHEALGWDCPSTENFGYFGVEIWCISNHV